MCVCAEDGKLGEAEGKKWEEMIYSISIKNIIFNRDSSSPMMLPWYKTI